MKLNRDETTITLKGNDEHRALSVALLFAIEAANECIRKNEISSGFIRSGIDNLRELVHVRDVSSEIVEGI